MKWVKSKVNFVEDVNATQIIDEIEFACRTCYQSYDKVTEGSGEKLIRSCISRGHESILEHAAITFKIICDRGVSHELVRHRMASYSQESTRYCNYGKEKYNSELTFVYPWWWDDNFLYESSMEQVVKWYLLNDACRNAESIYLNMIKRGATPDEARAILPNALKTTVVCTMNLRELRYFIKLRGSRYAHPDIRCIAREMLKQLRDAGLGVFFEDIHFEEVDGSKV